MQEPSRPLRRYGITPYLLSNLFCDGHQICFSVSDGVPPSAELVNSFHDPRTGIFWLVFEDASFAPVELGDIIPTDTVTWNPVTPHALEG